MLRDPARQRHESVGQLLPQRLGQIGHRLERLRSRDEQPAPQLPGAQRLLAALVEPGAQRIIGQIQQPWQLLAKAGRGCDG